MGKQHMRLKQRLKKKLSAKRKQTNSDSKQHKCQTQQQRELPYPIKTDSLAAKATFEQMTHKHSAGFLAISKGINLRRDGTGARSW